MRLSSVALTLTFVLTGFGAWAQDYSANKTPQQLFAGDCSACHKTPQGLAKGRDARALSGFLTEHYTSGPNSASLLAGYLAGGAGAGQLPAPARGKPETGAVAGDTSKPEKPERLDKPDRRQRGVIGRGEPGAAGVAEATKPASAERGSRRTGPSGKLHDYTSSGEGAKALTIAPASAQPDINSLKSYATSGEGVRSVEAKSSDVKPVEAAPGGASQPADNKPAEAAPSKPAEAASGDAKPLAN